MQYILQTPITFLNLDQGITKQIVSIDFQELKGVHILAQEESLQGLIEDFDDSLRTIEIIKNTQSHLKLIGGDKYSLEEQNIFKELILQVLDTQKTSHYMTKAKFYNRIDKLIQNTYFNHTYGSLAIGLDTEGHSYGLIKKHYQDLTEPDIKGIRELFIQKKK
jgi:hypothetical protein